MQRFTPREPSKTDLWRAHLSDALTELHRKALMYTLKVKHTCAHLNTKLGHVIIYN